MATRRQNFMLFVFFAWNNSKCPALLHSMISKGKIFFSYKVEVLTPTTHKRSFRKSKGNSISFSPLQSESTYTIWRKVLLHYTNRDFSGTEFKYRL